MTVEHLCAARIYPEAEQDGAQSKRVAEATGAISFCRADVGHLICFPHALLIMLSGPCQLHDCIICQAR